MRKTLKKIFHFALYGALIFSFINCEYEEKNETTIILQEKSFTVKRLKFDEISKNSKVIEKLNKLNKNRKSNKDENGKIIYSTENEFYVDTSYADYIVDENGKYSYTFKVFRNDPEYLLENIVLSSNDSLGFDLHFVQYDITLLELNQLKNGELLNLSQKTLVYKISDNSFINQLFNKSLIVDIGTPGCLISINFVQGSHCGCEEQHPYGAACTCSIPAINDTIIFTWGACPTESGGGGGTPAPGDPNDPTLPGSGCKGCGDINTTPVFEEEEITINTPCDELNKLTQNPTLPNYPNMGAQDKNPRIAIINMKNEVNPNNEKGYAFLNVQPNGIPEYAPYAQYTQPPVGDPNHVYFSSPFMFGTIHTHPNDGVHIPMFSHDDIYSLLSTAENYIPNNSSGNDLFVCVLTVQIGGSSFTYAIKIEDLTKLQKLKNLNPNANGTKTKWERFGEKLKVKYDKNAGGVSGSPSLYEKTFLQFIEDLDLGVSLYEMEQENAGTPDVTENWKKLELNGNKPLKEIPCN